MLQQIKILRRPQRCFRASPRHPQRPKGASGDLLRFTCLAAALLCSCSSSQIPLQQFEAANRSYFPPFVTNYFQATEYFTKDFPSLAEARSDIKLIQIRPLNDNVNQQQNETNLSWSADGAFLSYEVMLGNERKILVKNLKGDYTHQLLVLPQGKNTFLDGVIYRAIHSYNAGLSWSKDSTRFAFMSNGGVGEYNIYVGGIGAKEEPVAKSPSKDGYATWNPQGGELAFVSARTGNGDIYLYEFSSQKTKQLSQGNSVDIFPEWSPDGKRVVFCGGDAFNHDIFLTERNQYGRWSEPFRITQWSEDDLRPTVSPDGKFVAFYSSSSDKQDRITNSKTWNIHVLPMEFSKVYKTLDMTNTIVARDVVVDLNTGPSWSPDSRKIFFVKHDPKLFNPIYGYDLFSGRQYVLETKTKMNRDILMSNLGVLSFRAQVGAWDRVFVALTNQGVQLQKPFSQTLGKVHYVKL